MSCAASSSPASGPTDLASSTRSTASTVCHPSRFSGWRYGVVRGTFDPGVMGRWIAMRPRWSRFGVAALATVVLATGFGVTAELLAGQGPDTSLRLKSVSPAQLDLLGIKLVA